MQKLLPAILFVLGLCTFCLAQNPQPSPSPTPKTGSGVGSGSGSGSGSGIGNGSDGSGRSSGTQILLPSKTAGSESVRILSKPRANYTNAAKINDTEGVVRLRVTFLASGEIGSVLPVSGLSYGLTEEAIAAARQIKFTPATKDGVPVSVTKVLEYKFSLFYWEDDPDLASNARILEKPEPERPQKNEFRELGGKVRVKVVFQPDGLLRVVEVNSELPKEFQDAARKAAVNIKFGPAMHKDGNPVTQSKVIEYEFKPQND